MTTPDIRDLLTHASDSFRTVCLEFTHTGHIALLHRAVERGLPDLEARLQAGSIARISAPGFDSDSGIVDSSQTSRTDCRVWWRKTDAWRDDITWEDHSTVISIVSGAGSSGYVSALKTLYTDRRGASTGLFDRFRPAPSPREFPYVPTLERRLAGVQLLTPQFVDSAWKLTIVDEQPYLGRAALRVDAKWIASDSYRTAADSLDEYDVVVDQERGVLLRQAAIVDGEEARVLAVSSVRFDEPIPDDVFAFEPPKGTRVVRV